MSLDVDRDPELPPGLTGTEAEQRLAEHGANSLPRPKAVPFARRLVRQFQNALVYLLVFALVFDLGVWWSEGASSSPVEALTIFIVLALNAFLGVAQEYRSERALRQLETLSLPLVWTVRDGGLQRVMSDALVPGDVIRVEAGDRIPADGTVTRSLSLAVDESVLTGESMAVHKHESDPISAGTLIVRGHAFATITRTGERSALGRLASSLKTIEVSKTPLERRIDELGGKIARYVAALSVVLVVGFVVTEGVSHIARAVMLAAALAVAVVPEGMPAVITLALALGVQRMAKSRAVVRRLAAVEALGSVTVIATDKTGTLTENRMAVQNVQATDGHAALTAMVLANDADVGVAVGDPLEVALLEYARKQGIDIAALRAERPRVAVKPFDSRWKYMRVTVQAGTERQAYLKGAVEVILDRCTLTSEARASWLERAQAEAAAGRRVLGLAKAQNDSEEDLEFLGLCCLWDPIRPEAEEAMQRAQRAGIRVLMITGDHPATARSIAGHVGIAGESVLTGAEFAALTPDERARAVSNTAVFARSSPEHKLALIEALKAQGEVVAMTGDGVNDAPALKRADVGIAMGQRGSDVAREVSDLVLTDDNFRTIVAAIEEGRIIFENIQKFIRFTFSTNVALMVLVVGAAAAAFATDRRTASGALLLPLSALQILWINFLGDGPPALALSVDRDDTVMERPPRGGREPLFDRTSTLFILGTGLYNGATGLLLLLLLRSTGASIVAIQTSVFLYESVAKLLGVYPARRIGGSVGRNPWLHAAVAAGLIIQTACLLLPPLRRLLSLVVPPASALIIVAVALVSSVVAARVFTYWLTRAQGSAMPMGRSSAA